MSERPESEAQRETAGTDAPARVRRGWWPGWIWSVPIAALIVVAWLGLRALFARGEDITIRFADAHGVKKNDTDVEYRGTVVGQVSSVELSDRGDAAIVHVSIDERAAKFLRTGTRFWLKGANPSLSDLSSLGALLAGPTIEMEPGPGGPTRHFEGLAREPLVASSHSQPLLYIVPLKGSAGALKSGDPVELDGFTVGEVREVGFDYDARSGELSMPSTLALYPTRLFRLEGEESRAAPAALRAAINDLIGRGMRARLERDPPLVGSYRIELAIVPGASRTVPASLDGLPEIPFAPAGGLESIVTRFDKVPIEQIAQNLLTATHHIDGLVSSPQLEQSITRLDASLGQIQHLTATAGPQITQLVASLRRTADELDRTAHSAEALMGGTATQTGLSATLEEVSEAARALRSFANYLDENPRALLTGRSEGR